MGNFLSIAAGHAQYATNFAYGLAYGFPNPLLLDATPETLKQAIRDKGKEVLQYRFKDVETYTPLEYSILNEDKESFLTLLEHGAEYKVSLATSPFQFYLDRLNSGKVPDVEMFNLILDRFPDINELDSRSGLTPLAHMLKEMIYYGNFHWKIVEELLKRGSKIDGESRNTPFGILERADFFKRRPEVPERAPIRALEDIDFLPLGYGKENKISNYFKNEFGTFERTPKEENNYLERLITYVQLERKYNTSSNSCLTLKSFKFETSHLKRRLSIILNDIIALRHPGNINYLSDLGKVLDPLGKYYKALTKEGKFTDCFEEWELKVIYRALKYHENNLYFALEETVELFKEAGLFDNPPTSSLMEKILVPNDLQEEWYS